MSDRRSRSRHVLSTAADSRGRSVAPYSISAAARGCRRSVDRSAAEGRRRSVDRSAALRSLASTLPPGYDPSLLPTCTWPPTQSSRDSLHYGAVPEPEAKRAAAAIEAEAFAAISEYASGVTLASRKERFAVYKMYLKEACDWLLGFFKSRAAARGAMVEPGDSSAPTLALAASTSEE
ncbi:hypothetical protein VPH35_088821 [Triticum aestivum]